MMTIRHLLAIGMFCAILAGCGGGDGCHYTGFAMLVSTSVPDAVGDHSALPPENQVLYIAAQGTMKDGTGTGCFGDNLMRYAHAKWTTSDPLNVSISSADDDTNGLATCLGVTAPGATVSATLTAFGFTQTKSAPITCK